MCASYFYFIEKPDFSKLSLLSFSSSEQFKKDCFKNNYYIHFIFFTFTEDSTLKSQITIAPSRPTLLYCTTLALSSDTIRSCLQSTTQSNS